MTPEVAGCPIVVDEAVAGPATADEAGIIHRVPRTMSGRRGSGRLDPDMAIEVITDAGDRAIVLARPVWADPAMSPLPALAVAMGHEVVWLPHEAPAAAWATCLIASWAPALDRADLLRRAQVAVGLAHLPMPALPRRPWGVDGTDVPALSADALGRWCECAWTPCGWCPAGGAASARCPACGHAGEFP
jgi:hypothetical protein